MNQLILCHRTSVFCNSCRTLEYRKKGTAGFLMFSKDAFNPENVRGIEMEH